jgi:hypothetical protein
MNAVPRLPGTAGKKKSSFLINMFLAAIMIWSASFDFSPAFLLKSMQQI